MMPAGNGDKTVKTTNKATIETVHVSECEARGLLFESAKEGSRCGVTRKGQRYAWGDYETSEVSGPARLSAAVDDWGLEGGTWVVFYLDDCAFPPMYVFRGASFEDAYGAFIDWHAEHAWGLKIEDDEMGDYEEDRLNFTSNGIPVDTESVRGFEVKLVEIRVA